MILARDTKTTQKFASTLQRAFGQTLAIQIVVDPRDFVNSPRRTILISSPASVQKALSEQATMPSFSTVIAFDFHLLDCAYELVLTHFKRAVECRLILLSFPLFDASSAASFIDCPEEHTYAFGPNTRSVPLQTDIRPISTARAGAFLQTALKPTHEMLKEEGQPAICVVPSAGSCKLAAATFVRQLAADLNPDSFVGDATMLEEAATLLPPSEDELCDVMLHGISVCHEAMPLQSRRLMLRLFNSGATRLMVTTPGVCLGQGVTAPMLVVVGIQTPLISDDGARILADYDPARLYQLQNVPSGARAKCVFLCEPHQEDSSLTPLKNGLLLESELLDSSYMLQHCLEGISTDTSFQPSSLMPLLSATFASQRVRANPGYYGFTSLSHASNLSRAAERIFHKLRGQCCAFQDAEEHWRISSLGRAVLAKEVDLDALTALRETPLSMLLAYFKEGTSSSGKVEVPKDALKHYVSP